MWRLIKMAGFFKDERVNGIEENLVVINNKLSVVEEENTNLKTENMLMKTEMSELKKLYAEKDIKINTLYENNAELKEQNERTIKRIEMLEKLFEMMKAEKEEIKKDNTYNSTKPINKWLKIKDMANAIGFSNETIISYYLVEKGVFVLKVNLMRNTFELSEKWLEKMKAENVLEKFRLNDGKLEFHADLIDYFIKNKDYMKEVYAKYLRKNKRFKESKKRIDGNRVADYQKEISAICGTFGGYDKEKWRNVYNDFRKVYPTLEKDYDAYIEEFGKISKIKFVVTELGLGDLMLRIACALYA